MNETVTVTRDFHVTRRNRGYKKLNAGAAPDLPQGRVPRISRLMALAIYCDHLIRTSVVESQTDLANFGHITTARMTQIMALLNLAPDIQEEILFLPRTRHGHDPVGESDIQPLIVTFDWQVQRRRWQQVLAAKRLMEGMARY